MIVFPSNVFDKGNNFTTHNQSNIHFEFFFAQSIKILTFGWQFFAFFDHLSPYISYKLLAYLPTSSCKRSLCNHFLEKSEMHFLLILMVFGFGLVQSRLLMTDYLLQTATKKCTIDRLLELKNT